MKKIILLILIMTITLCGITQEKYYTPIAQRYEWLAGLFQALGLPAGDGPAAFQPGQKVRAGAVYYDSAGVDAGFYLWNSTTWELITAGAGGGTWGSITGTLSAQTDLQNALDLKAPLASPTFTGTIGTPLTASRSVVTGSSGELAVSATTAAEIAHVNGVTSAIQTQIDARLQKTKLGHDFTLVSDSLFMYSWNTPLRYGAVGNGSTNDQAALQAACNAAKGVFIPPGYNFRVTTSVTMQAGQIMFGMGDKSIISIIANTRAVILDSNCRITGIKFIGNGKAGSGVFNTGIMATAAVGWSIDHCYFYDFAGDPTQNGGGGVYVAVLNSNNSDGGRVYGNYFFNNDGALVFVNRGEYVTAHGNNFGANTVAILKGAGNLTITSNTLNNNTTGIKSITGTNVAHSIVANNIINHNTYPYWIEDVTYDLGDSYSANELYYGAIKIIRSQNLRFVNETWGIIDSIHLDDAKSISHVGLWLGLTQANAKVPIKFYNGAQMWDDIGRKRTRLDSVSNWITQNPALRDTNSFSGPTYIDNSLSLTTAGSKLKIASGSNASIGVSAAMTAGTITISTTAVTASSIIMLTNAAPGGGTVGVLSVGTITPGVSFIINSSSGTDVSTVNWWIIN